MDIALKWSHGGYCLSSMPSLSSVTVEPYSLASMVIVLFTSASMMRRKENLIMSPLFHSHPKIKQSIKHIEDQDTAEAVTLIHKALKMLEDEIKDLKQEVHRLKSQIQ